MARHSFAATVVSEALATEGTLVVVGYTDGTCKSYRLAFNAPEPTPKVWYWQTEAHLLKLFNAHNQMQMERANANLHADKVRRLGWDHAARGY